MMTLRNWLMLGVSIVFGGVFFFSNSSIANATSLANDQILTMSIQSDDKTIIGGYFTFFNDVPINRIARINADGSLDTTFNPGTGASWGVLDSEIQTDGKIVISGQFTSYNGVTRNRIARINADGSLDTTFNPGTGANNGVQALAIQSDGKIIIGGQFTSYNGVSRNRIARINADGSLDTTFNPGTGANNSIRAIRVQPDGKIVVVGSFTMFNSVIKYNLVRLETNGSIDSSFNIGTGANDWVDTLAIQSDGKIILGGLLFTAYNGVARNHIARINTDGSLDTSFDPGTGATGGINGSVYDISIQSDGKIILVGGFAAYNGVARNHIARINTDGSLDISFDPGTGTNDAVNSVVLRSDNKILIGGDFTTFNELGRNRMTLVEFNGANDNTFAPNIAPAVDSQVAEDVSWTAATGFGNITSTGGENPVRDIQWGTSSGNYTDSCSAGSGGVGVYSCVMNNLLPGTMYYVRARAINSAGTSYGSETSFTTLSIIVPALTTDAPTYISSSSINGVGNITTTGGENPTRHIEWGTTSGNYTSSCSAGIGGTGQYSCQMTGLTAGQTYYIRAYATNSAGTAYGNEIAYTHVASLTETIIPHEFIGGGTAQGWQGDEETWSYILPFDFPFYGTTYTAGTSIGITSNGQICLEDDTNCVDYNNDITTTIHGPFITPLWTDLDSANGDIYITENADHIIIRWETEEYGVTGTINFEAILYSNGNIKFNYDTQTTPLQNVTSSVGISKGDGTYTASIYNTNTNFNQVDTSAWGEFTSGGGSGTGINDQNNLNLTISENLTLNCGSSIDLDNGTTLTAGTPQTNTTTCQVTTNDQSGYNLSLTDDRTTSNALYHTTNNATQDGQIQDKTPWNTTTPNAQPWNGTGLGFGIQSSTATKNESWWGNANNCNDTTQLYAGLPDTDTNIMEHTTYSNTHTDTTICYKLDIPSTQLSGEYEGSVTYTAAGRP